MQNNKYTKDTYPQIINDPLRVSVFGAVRKLREQRMLMVKNEQQYLFVYAYIGRWIEQNYEALQKKIIQWIF